MDAPNQHSFTLRVADGILSGNIDICGRFALGAARGKWEGSSDHPKCRNEESREGA
jgi:hypothetical protein